MTPNTDDLIVDFVSSYVDLTDAEKDSIRSLGLIRSVPRGATLLGQGDTATEGYFILRGLIRYHRLVDGIEKTTDFFLEGDAVEPRSLMDQLPSEHAISCVEDSLLFVSTPEMEQEMMAQLPKLERVCRLVAEESLRTHTDMLVDFKLLSPQQRYERLLTTRPELIQRVPQYMIASYLGVTPESLSRIRSRLATG